MADLESINHLGSLRMVYPKEMNFNARMNCGITLLFLCSWDFCTYWEVLLGERSIRYSTQIKSILFVLYGSIALYARIHDFW